MQLLRLLPPVFRPTHIPRTLIPSPTPADPVPVTDDTATHTPTPVITVDTTSRRGDTPPGEHAAPAGHIPPHGPPPLQAIAPQPHLPPLTLPPAQVPPTTLPRTQDHGSTSSPANPHLPRFHFPAHFRMALHAGGTSTSRWGKHRHSTSNTGNWSSQDKRQSWPKQQPGQQPHPPSRAGRNNASMPPTPAPAAAFPTPPPRPAPSQPSPQHPLDDIEDLDPPPSEAELNTNSDNRWLDPWRSVMDTAKTDPMRVPTRNSPRELEAASSLGHPRMEQTKAILTNLDPALPPSHPDLLAECWELRTMDMDEPIAFEPSFYHLLGRESHGMVFATTWFPRPHPWPVADGHPEAGSRCHVCTRHHPGSNAPHVL